jgi:hypothetical protein
MGACCASHTHVERMLMPIKKSLPTSPIRPQMHELTLFLGFLIRGFACLVLQKRRMAGRYILPYFDGRVHVSMGLFTARRYPDESNCMSFKPGLPSTCRRAKSI